MLMLKPECTGDRGGCQRSCKVSSYIPSLAQGLSYLASIRIPPGGLVGTDLCPLPRDSDSWVWGEVGEFASLMLPVGPCQGSHFESRCPSAPMRRGQFWPLDMAPPAGSVMKAPCQGHSHRSPSAEELMGLGREAAQPSAGGSEGEVPGKGAQVGQGRFGESDT